MELNNVNLNLMLETAVAAARLAGKFAIEEQARLKISVKNNNEIVTNADSRCQQIIVEKISADFPDDGFIAEEGTEGKIFKQNPKNTK